MFPPGPEPSGHCPAATPPRRAYARTADRARTPGVPRRTARRGAQRRQRRCPAAARRADLVRLPAGRHHHFFTGTQGRKARKTWLIGKAGVLSLAVQREAFPYRYVTVEGTVVHTDRPPSAAQMQAFVRRYLPEEYTQGFVAAELDHPGPELVLFTVRPDRWLSFDFGDDAG